MTAHVMRYYTNHFRVFAILCLLCIVSVAASATTPVGTIIKATSVANYSSTTGLAMPTTTSNTVSTTVTQSASLTVSPSSASKAVDSSRTADFGITITNTGNGNDSYTLMTSAKSGSSVSIYRDDNGDGVRQSTETTKVTNSGTVSAGSTSKLIVSVLLASSATGDTVIFTAQSAYDSTKSAQATLSVLSAQSAYNRSWLINGYYSGNRSVRLSKDFLNGEGSISPYAGLVTSGKTWKVADSTSDSIDLNTLFGGPDSCTAYAFAYVYSTKAQMANLWCGSDDGIKIWFNGAVIWTNDIIRGVTPDQDRMKVNLIAGWNRLLIKVADNTQGWGFIAKICDAYGNAIPGVSYSTVGPGVSTSAVLPLISNVKATCGTISATIEWDTDVPSTTLVEYGDSTSYGTSYQDTNLTTHHVAPLANLQPGTTYYYKVGSGVSGGSNAWDANHTFTALNVATFTGTYIDSWLQQGYYTAPGSTRLPTDWLGGEASAAPIAGDVVNGSEWFAVNATNDYIDIGASWGYPTGSVAYAFVYVFSPVVQSGYIFDGSDDGIKVWLNGYNVWTNDVYRGAQPDQDKFPVTLQIGWNRLLVKVSNDTGGWGFLVRICDTNGNPIPSLYYTLGT